MMLTGHPRYTQQLSRTVQGGVLRVWLLLLLVGSADGTMRAPAPLHYSAVVSVCTARHAQSVRAAAARHSSSGRAAPCGRPASVAGG